MPSLDPLIQAKVVLRLSHEFGLTVEVEGPTRANVEGLHARLLDTLARGHRPIGAFYSPWWVATLGGLGLGTGGLVLGIETARRLGFGTFGDDTWSTGELVGGITGAAVGVLAALTAAWLFPTLEIVREGEQTRFRRFRGAAFGGAAVLTLSVIGAWLYDAMT